MARSELNDELLRRRQDARLGGGPEAIERQHAKGKRTARERIDALVDAGSFQEVDPYITHRHTAFGLDEKRCPGDAVVVGFARVDGRPIALAAQDFTVIGGSFSEAQAQKVCQVLDLALKAGTPFVALNDSVGARIQEGVWSLAGYAELFWRNTQASGVIPQISVMLGPCAGGSVYSPGLTDFIIMTEGMSHMFITGPEVIKTVTGEEVDFEMLGGAQTHAAVSGVAHFVAADEDEALTVTRRLLDYLPPNNAAPPVRVAPTDDPARADPELDSLVPLEDSESYDIRQAINRIFDLDSFFEVHARFAPNAVAGFARLHGEVVGVVANQPAWLAGVLDINASDKIARFVRFCDAFHIPLVTFVDCPGFMPGTVQEHGGIIRHGAKIVYAYSEATVPKLCVVTRKAYGGAYIVMSSKYIRTDLVFAWPTAEIAVLGAEGAVNILYRKRLAEEQDTAARERFVAEFREQFGSPYAAAASGHVDDVILPSETRGRLIAALDYLRDKQVPGVPKKHGCMPL
ncbi:MAG: acyl-CoA carboxylase subunit beta [Anaerolineae bacterium]|jgi:acetyl-CoA carboxylase carboxyltransferase component|nr:acyl-CoA carboxylase subunit beta [Anaerolineae bacterium]MDX9829652.1 acyl-CoA carboxylase subunit beta [Anaerolineae bacterium]